jgi:hypothetical protein
VSNAELVLIGTLGGAAIGAGATLGVTYVQDRLARRDRRDAELAAGIDYFAAADRLANQYAQLPPVSETWVHRGIDRLLGKRGATMRARMMNRPVIGDRWEALTDDFLRASARFRLAAPAGLQTSIDEVTALIAEWSTNTGPGRLKDWRQKRRALETEFRARVHPGERSG